MKSRTTSRLPTSTHSSSTGLHLGHLGRQRGQHVARRLPRPGVVERPDDHHVRAVRQVVLDPQQVDRRLARRVWVVGPQRAILPHRDELRRRVAVAGPRADQDHPRLQARRLHGLEQVQRAAQVQRPGAPRIGDARLRVRLRRQVVDRLGLLAPHQLGQVVLGRLDQVEPLDPHAHDPGGDRSAGHRPDAERPTTWSPAATRCSQRCPPTKPETPVTSARMPTNPRMLAAVADAGSGGRPSARRPRVRRSYEGPEGQTSAVR